ncbi:MAG: S9 family peptidase [candidate division Zixibacteria bacterium]|nr:S9 family peptidase [candidate division Zixibacteria bacterium]
MGCSNGSSQVPETLIIPVTDTYHGVEVVDNYRWLENGQASDVSRWDEAQTSHTSRYLDKISYRENIAQHLKALYTESSPEYSKFHYKGGKLFAIKDQPPKEQPLLVALDTPSDLGTEKVILDPNDLDTTGLTSIDFFEVSPNAGLVAVSLSKGGTEDGDIYIFEVETGKKLSDYVPRVNGPTAGGDVAWKADGSGFYYTHYPREKERPADELRFYQQVYYHDLGKPTEEDIYVIGKEFPKIAEVYFESSDDSEYIIAGVANGDGGEYAHYLLNPSGKWTQVTRFEDDIPDVLFGLDNSLYLLSHRDASYGKILYLAPGRTKLSQARMIVAEGSNVIRSFLPTKTKLYVRDMMGGPSQIRVIDLIDHSETRVPLLPVSSAWGLTGLEGDIIIFTNSSYTEPSVVYSYDPAEELPRKTAMVVTSIADFSDVEVIREIAFSKDGTRVPINILRNKGTKLDGTNPTILYGYGGYGSSQTPWFKRDRSIYLNNGVIYVTANIRGGGEFGEQWHLSGNLTNKQNVFDDFAACARYLIDNGYTNPSKLAIMGGSNGGLLVGATMTQNPELFKAVVCMKGVLDMLRFESEPNGVFNVTEYGSVTDPDQFKALYAYSPYHSIKQGVRYPDVLFTADVNDYRVGAGNSRKMAARLQTIADPRTMVLLRMSEGAGHGIGSSLSASLDQKADIMTFLFDRLGVNYGSKDIE